MDKPLCIIAGVGPGNGLAFCERFHKAGYRIALLARSLERMQDYAEGHEDISPFPVTYPTPDSITATFAQILATLGTPNVVIYNAGGGLFASALDTTFNDFENAWKVNALGLLAVSQAVVPAMTKNGGGSLLVTGATASLRGGANFAAFSSAKAAQRNLTQSLARSLGSEGIHVALVIIDGVIDIPRTREMFPDKADDTFLKPQAIAETYFHLAQQDQSAWTFEVDLRPNTESW